MDTHAVKQYALITANYWFFTLTDGALRMLILMHFHQLGYTPFELASLFLFYEFFGVVTNLLGGWLGARIGLNKTMNIGLFLQIAALSMLIVPSHLLTVVWVMSAQAVSGIAKDLNKMSAKTSVKLLLATSTDTNADSQKSKLFKWVAILTGSKNTLKGIGFFLGGFLLSQLGFANANLSMLIVLLIVWLFSLLLLKKDLGKMAYKPKFTQVFSKSKAINLISAARFFLFASRDVWFVIALPVFLASQFQWSHSQIGAFFALWIIGYGVVQSITPKFLKKKADNKTAAFWSIPLAMIPLILAVLMEPAQPVKHALPLLLVGLSIFAVLFAINSSVHSFLIVDFSRDTGASLDVGFYYMANASGRLIGTVLSGWLYQSYGLSACLYTSGIFILLASLFAKLIKSSSR